MKKIITRVINKETIDYLIFGVLTTLVNLVSYKGLTLLGFDYRLATLSAWFIAVIFAYITNKIFVFKSHGFDLLTLKREMPAFLTSRLMSGAFDLMFMIAAVEIFGIDDFVAKLLTNIFVVIINYVASKYWVFKKTEETQKDCVFLISFLLPVLILLVIYIFRGIYPFGENCYLPSDMYHQYAPFYMEMHQKLLNKGSLLYSWHTGMGVNFIGLYAYYLSSPMNWFLFLSPEKYIIETMSLLIMLKTGLSSLTFSYYLSRRYQTRHISIAAFGLFYALSSYFSAFSWNIMWLDCLLLFPLILLGIEKLVKEKKPLLYCIALSFSIVSNYYISIMICLFSLLYFLMIVFTDSTKRKRGYYLKRVVDFTVYSLIAGGMAAILIVPEYFSIKASASGNFNFPNTFTQYFSIFDILSRGLMNVETSVLSGRYPNIYSSVSVFLLLPLYWMNDSGAFKEKVGKTILILIMLVSFNMNVFNFIWHGLHFPNSLPARQSFIFIFLVLSMSYEGFLGIKKYAKGQIFSVYSGVIIFFLMVEKWIVSDQYHFGTVYLNMAFLTFYLFIFIYYRKENCKPKLMAFLFFLIVIAEVSTNTASTGLGTTSRTIYTSDNHEISELLKEIKEEDPSFYRIEKFNRRTNNDSAWNQYKGVSTFSSTAYAGLNNLLDDLGFRSSMNSYSFAGATPLTASLFSVKYMLSDELLADTALTRLRDETENIYLYENLYTLPLGFIVPDNLNEMWRNDNSSPFRVQNQLVELLSASEPLFDPVHSTSSGKTVSIDVKDDRDIYLYISNSATLKKVYVNKAPNSDMSESSISFQDLKHKHILFIGKGTPGEKISVSTDSEEISSLYLSAWSFNEDVFLEVFHHLNQNPFMTEIVEDSYVKGVLETEKGGVMLTSIPYDKGWTAHIDGEKVNLSSLKEAFLSVSVPTGKHTIEFFYFPEGLKAGLIISFASILLLLGILLSSRRSKQGTPLDNYAINDIIIEEK